MEHRKKSNRAKNGSDGDSWELLISGDRKQSLKAFKILRHPTFFFPLTHNTKQHKRTQMHARPCTIPLRSITTYSASWERWMGRQWFLILSALCGWVIFSVEHVLPLLTLPTRPPLPTPPPPPSHPRLYTPCCSEDCLLFPGVIGVITTNGFTVLGTFRRRNVGESRF